MTTNIKNNNNKEEAETELSEDELSKQLRVASDRAANVSAEKNGDVYAENAQKILAHALKKKFMTTDTVIEAFKAGKAMSLSDTKRVYNNGLQQVPSQIKNQYSSSRKKASDDQKVKAVEEMGAALRKAAKDLDLPERDALEWGNLYRTKIVQTLFSKVIAAETTKCVTGSTMYRMNGLLANMTMLDMFDFVVRARFSAFVHFCAFYLSKGWLFVQPAGTKYGTIEVVSEHYYLTDKGLAHFKGTLKTGLPDSLDQLADFAAENVDTHAQGILSVANVIDAKKGNQCIDVRKTKDKSTVVGPIRENMAKYIVAAGYIKKLAKIKFMIDPLSKEDAGFQLYHEALSMLQTTVRSINAVLGVKGGPNTRRTPALGAVKESILAGATLDAPSKKQVGKKKTVTKAEEKKEKEREKESDGEEEEKSKPVTDNDAKALMAMLGQALRGGEK